MPQMLFYGFATLATALLQARRRFAAAAFAPILNNVVVIAIFLVAPARRRRSAHGPPRQRRLGARAAPRTRDDGRRRGDGARARARAARARGSTCASSSSLRHAAVRTLVRLSGWTFGYVVANQIALWVVLVLANGVHGGAFAYLSAYAFFQLPARTLLGVDHDGGRARARGRRGARRPGRAAPSVRARAAPRPDGRDPGRGGVRRARAPARRRAAAARRVLAERREPRRRHARRLRRRPARSSPPISSRSAPSTRSRTRERRSCSTASRTRSNIGLALWLFDELGIEGLSFAFSGAYAVAARRDARRAVATHRRAPGARRSARRSSGSASSSAAGGPGRVDDEQGDRLVRARGRDRERGRRPGRRAPRSRRSACGSARVDEFQEVLALLRASTRSTTGPASVLRRRPARHGDAGERRGPSRGTMTAAPESRRDRPTGEEEGHGSPSRHRQRVRPAPGADRPHAHRGRAADDPLRDEELVDREELSTDEFWDRLKSSAVLPETAAPSAGAFEACFRGLIERRRDRDRLHQPVVATRRPRCRPRRSPPRRSAPTARSRSSTRSRARWGSARCASPRRGAAPTATPREDRRRGDRPPRPDPALRRARHARVPEEGRPHRERRARCSARCCRSSRSSRCATASSRRPARCARARSRSSSSPTRSRASRSTRSPCCTARRPTSTSCSTCSQDTFPRDEIVTGVVGPVIGTHAGPGVIGVTFQVSRRLAATPPGRRARSLRRSTAPRSLDSSSGGQRR